MGLISTIEEKLENLVEKPFRGKNDLDPLLIEIAVKRQLLKQRKDLLGKIMVPNDLEITMAHKLYEDYEPFFIEFKTGLRKTLKEWLKDNGYEMAGPIQINFRKGSWGADRMSVLATFSSGGIRHGQDDEIPKEFPKKKEVSNNKVPNKKKLGELLITNTGQRFKIYEKETIIGRDSGCDIPINDLTVSRIHAAITMQFGRFILEDLGSKSGTRVNLTSINKAPLSPGDRILIGETEFVFNQNDAL